MRLTFCSLWLHTIYYMHSSHFIRVHSTSTSLLNALGRCSGGRCADPAWLALNLELEKTRHMWGLGRCVGGWCMHPAQISLRYLGGSNVVRLALRIGAQEPADVPALSSKPCDW